MALKPLVSIIIQTYNRSKLLAYAIESAISQSYKNIEILIGDNCSTDDTEYIVLKYKNLDNRIKYYRHNSNIGMIKNANFLLNKVHGDYFVFLNDDDWLDLNYVSECVDFLKKNKDYTICSPTTVIFNNHHTQGRECTLINLEGDIIERITNYISRQDNILTSSGLYRSSVLRTIMKYEGTFLKPRYNEDIIFNIKFLMAGKGKMLSNVHYNKLNNGSSMKLETTTSDIYPTNGLTYKNLGNSRKKIFIRSILYSKYSDKFIREKSIHKLVKNIYRIEFNQYGYKDLIKYIWVHPLFFRRRKFYSILQSIHLNKINRQLR